MFWTRLRRAEAKVALLVTDRPGLLIPLAPAYLALTFFVALACNGAGDLSAHIYWYFTPDQKRHLYLGYQIARVLFFPAAALVWLHYLRLALLCFWAAASARMTAFGVSQLVAVTVLIFAAAHYYVALFSTSQSYANLPNPKPEPGWADLGDFDDRLFFVPTLETVVNFVYFSTVTTATVGYGDIAPLSIPAKLLTVVQIGLSFVLIVVVLAWVVGRTPGGPSSSGEGHS